MFEHTLSGLFAPIDHGARECRLRAHHVVTTQVEHGTARGREPRPPGPPVEEQPVNPHHPSPASSGPHRRTRTGHRLGDAALRAAHQQAGDIYREVGDRHGEGTAWGNLGIALQEVRRFDEAIIAYCQDITICAELDNQYEQAQTLANLGAVHVERDDPDQARQAWIDAVDLYTAVGADDDAARVQEWMGDLGR